MSAIISSTISVCRRTILELMEYGQKAIDAAVSRQVRFCMGTAQHAHRFSGLCYIRFSTGASTKTKDI